MFLIHKYLLIFSIMGIAFFATPLIAQNNTSSNAQINDFKIQNNMSAQDIEKALTFNILPSYEDRINAIQWMIKGEKEGEKIANNKKYQLFNMSHGAALKHETRPIGPNLKWLAGNSTTMNLTIKKKDGSPIRYGDTVALHIKPYGWLRYKKQPRGVNLSDDDNNPHYIWVIKGSADKKLLVTGMPFALFNTTENNDLIYCVRTWGINLGWQDTSDCGSTLAKISDWLDDLGQSFYKNAKSRVCEAAITAASGYLVAQTGGTTAAGIAAAAPIAIKKCKEL